MISTRASAWFLVLAAATTASAAPVWEEVARPNRRRCSQWLEEAAQARAHDQTQTAAATLRKAGALCPDDREVLQALGEALLTLRQFPDARQALERARLAAREQPGSRDAEAALLFHLGFAREVTGDLEGAIESHRMLEAMGGLPAPNQYLVHYDLGDELMGTGRLGEAIDEYRRAVALAPDRAIPRLALAVALDRDGQSDKARSELSVVLSLDPQLRRMDSDEYVFVPAADVYFYRALAASARGVSAEARSWLRTFLAELPDGPYAHHARHRLDELEQTVDAREIDLIGGNIDTRALARSLSPLVRGLEDCLPAARVMRLAFTITPAGIRAQPAHPAAGCLDHVLSRVETTARRAAGVGSFSLPLAGRRAAASPP
jgi:tetratricopeptide (TPR) repeat protein